MQPLVIRVSRASYLAVGFAAVCATAVVRSPLQALIYLLPLAAAVFVARVRTIVDEQGVTARGLVGQRSIAWGDLGGLRIDPSGSVYAVARSGGELRLPCVRQNSLTQLAQASGGRLPDLSEPRG